MTRGASESTQTLQRKACQERLSDDLQILPPFIARQCVDKWLTDATEEKALKWGNILRVCIFTRRNTYRSFLIGNVISGQCEMSFLPPLE